MKSEIRLWTQMRERAETRLPRDFAQRIVNRSGEYEKRTRHEYVLIAITTLMSIALVTIANYYVGAIVQRNNLARWSVAEAQLRALRESL